MRLDRVLDDCSAAVRRKYGFIAIVSRAIGGYCVSLAEEGQEPHYEEVYASLEIVLSLFAETCSWQPLHKQDGGILEFQQYTAAPVYPYTRTQVERFWAKVDSVSNPDGCWLWHGNKNTSSGFGIARTERGRMLAHRVSWELTHSVVLTSEEYILHLSEVEGCGNILCVRPEHLYLSHERRVAPPKERSA